MRHITLRVDHHGRRHTMMHELLGVQQLDSDELAHGNKTFQGWKRQHFLQDFAQGASRALPVRISLKSLYTQSRRGVLAVLKGNSMQASASLYCSGH